eukprot:11208047-Heterocapsa_arctica.AAC.1
MLRNRFGVRFTEAQALERWPTGTISKMALLIKERDDGSRKLRLVVDLRRSGANALALVPERPVLPRLSDA